MAGMKVFIVSDGSHARPWLPSLIRSQENS